MDQSGRRGTRASTTRRAVATLAPAASVLAVLPARALAHGGGHDHGPVLPPVLAPVLLVASLAVLGTSLVVHSRRTVPREVADAGVLLGVLALLGSLYLLVT